MKISLFAGASVDGFVARLDDSLDFLRAGGGQGPTGVIAPADPGISRAMADCGSLTPVARARTHRPGIASADEQRSIGQMAALPASLTAC